jgi:putative peptide maturation dehydrogenase
MNSTPSIRRCRLLLLEPRHLLEFQLDVVFAGGDGLRANQGWLALAPHLDTPCQVEPDLLALLGQIEPERWQTAPCALEAPLLRRLIDLHLVFVEGTDSLQARRDEQLRGMKWWQPAAVMHWMARWQGRDSVSALYAAGLQSAEGLHRQLGPPPEATMCLEGPRTPLPRHSAGPLDILLESRSTCRNFDPTRSLPLATFARIMQRAFSATGEFMAAEGSVFLKKNAPSAGGLHPTEVYVLVQGVEGVEPGLYHYHPQHHELTRLPEPPGSVRTWAKVAMAGQHWFADAQVLAILAPRYARSYWKYRDHPKAYRAITLDVGHLSQLLLLCATEQGLGAFVTAAINEQDIEQVLNIDPMEQSPLAICGFGWRGEQMVTAEFDPGQRVWNAPLATSGDGQGDQPASKSTSTAPSPT